MFAIAGDGARRGDLSCIARRCSEFLLTSGTGPRSIAGPDTRRDPESPEIAGDQQWPATCLSDDDACSARIPVTLPRQVVSGRTYLMSRRCTQRQLLLRPDPQVAQIYLYCLGEAARRYDITLHGFIALSNHQHLLVRDNRGNFPEFLAHLNKLIAKAMNARLGRWENFWATEQPNAVYLVEPADRFAKLVYLLANPVADDLVDRISDWPGACSLALNLSGRSMTMKRPRGFFRANGKMPDEVTLRIERPDGFEDLSNE